MFFFVHMEFTYVVSLFFTAQAVIAMFCYDTVGCLQVSVYGFSGCLGCCCGCDIMYLEEKVRVLVGGFYFVGRIMEL